MSSLSRRAGASRPGLLNSCRGQTAVEYLLSTVTLVIVFAAMYGYLQTSIKQLYTAAAIKILTSYPRTAN